MPMSQAFRDRLEPILPEIVAQFGTPFHIYDEAGILETGHALNAAFSGVEFREFFAAKANPNPAILRLMQQLEFGFDCSSVPELILSRDVGAEGDDIMFTSNNTTEDEFLAAQADGGCILNLDDISLIDKVPGKFPELICFRYNPGRRRTGNDIIGNPVEAKYGVTHEQIVDAYRQARDRGATLFGMHTMVCSAELNPDYMVDTVAMLLEVIKMVSDELGIQFEFINMGGGLGIPYHPNDEALPLESMAQRICKLIHQFGNHNGYKPKLLMESGRWVMGPHGVLVTTCTNVKHIYREYRQVDACMSSLMRPGMYYPDGGYHHITVPGKDDGSTQIVDVVGSLCENNDKFAVQRVLPQIDVGDTLVIHDTGAHGIAMGFSYNGRLRPPELMHRIDGTVELIRRAETFADYTATLNFQPQVLTPASAQGGAS